MRDEMLDDQRELVEMLEAAGWDVTDVELTTYDSPWEEDAPEVSVTLSARKAYETSDDADDEDNPFRVK